MLKIVTPATPEHLDAVRELMRAFITWHRARHAEDRALIDSYFNQTEFDDELASLPGKYAPPDGALFLAMQDNAPAGCVALRRIDGVACEMKRMFVYPQFHGRGIGRALADAVIERARELNYRRMLLDTSWRQKEAQALYRSYGFRDVAPYYDLPDDLRSWLVFMERPLDDVNR